MSGAGGRRALRYVVLLLVALVGFRLATSWLGSHHPGVDAFAVAAGVAVVAGVAGRWLAERRSKQIAAWAQQTGWTYARRDPGLGLASVHSRPPFAQGRSRTVEHVLTGTYEGLRAVSFTYEWTTGTGDDQRTQQVHVVGVALPAYLPVLEVTPEGVGARLAKAFGARDLQLESAAFNAAYRVDAPDARTAHAILHPRTLERLLRPDALGMAWRIEGTWLLSWEGGATDTARIAPRLGVLAAVVRGVPRHVWQDHGHDPATTIAAHPESKESS